MRTFRSLTHRISLAAIAAAFALIVAPAMAATPISGLSLDQAGESVTISGTIAAFTASTGERIPNRLTVADDSGQVTVVIWPDVFGQLSPTPAQGAAVTITGEIGEYRNQLQVRVSDAGNVTVTSGGAAPAAAVPSPTGTPVTAAMEGETVTIAGQIESLRASGNPRAPNTLIVKGSHGEATVVIWPEVFDAISPAPAVGNSVRLTGPVGTYRDNVQVAVRDAANLQILDDAGSVISQAPAGTADTSAASAATSTSADAAGEAVAMAISDIDGSTVGKRVILEGRVVAFRASWSERAPNIISLSDGTSTIPVVAWADTWNALTRKPAEGDTIRLTGEVQLYEARNEIQVHLQSLEFPQ